MGKYLDMAERIKERDDDAIKRFEEHCQCHGTTLENRLAFVEGRLHDTIGLLYVTLKRLDEDETGGMK